MKIIKNVNLAYRIESYTVGGQIFISASTLEKVEPALLRIDGQMEVQPKGVKQPVLIYEVGGIGGEYNLFLPKEDDQFFPLSAQIPVRYALVDGKHGVGDRARRLLGSGCRSHEIEQTHANRYTVSNLLVD